MSLDLRPSPLAGSWYPANPKVLASQIDAYINAAQLPQLNGEVIALIAPHAGIQYSGHVAGHAFRAVQNKTFDTVVILSPFHSFSAHAILTSSHQAYSTPLGNIEIDQTALSELQNNLEIPIRPIAKDKEHAIEIELPFLQRALQNNFKLLPLMLRLQDNESAKQLGTALAKILKNKKTLLVASTDLSHFYNSVTAKKLDSEMLKRFESFNPESIFDAEEKEIGFACGHAAVATMFYTAKHLGAHKVQVVKYATSGDITKDYSSVVGYGAAMVSVVE